MVVGEHTHTYTLIIDIIDYKSSIVYLKQIFVHIQICVTEFIFICLHQKYMQVY